MKQSEELRVTEKRVKNVVVKTGLPDIDYVANPYVGCQHRCVYCYAEFMKRFTDHHEPWGTFVDVKVNAVDTVKPLKYRGKRILLSSVTDPYQPLENRYQLTRRLLLALIPGQPSIEILTKSSLVLRDLEILKQFEDAAVGVSISTLDSAISRQLEPFASEPKARLQALKKCKEEGIKTYTFLSPLIPTITNVSEIIEEALPFSDFFLFENLNLRTMTSGKIKAALKKISPALPLKLKWMYHQNSRYWRDVELKWQSFCQERGIEAFFFFHY